jgi:hypothetical protein
MAPDPKTLYAVTGFVFAGLTVWLLMVLRSAKEPWAKPVAQAPAKLKVPSEPLESDEDEDDDDADDEADEEKKSTESKRDEKT